MIQLELTQKDFELICTAVERWRNTLLLDNWIYGQICEGILYHDLSTLLMKLLETRG